MAEPFANYKQGLQKYLSEYLSLHAESRDGLLLASAPAAIVAHVDVELEQPRMFSILVCHDGVTALRYDFTKATQAALAAVGASTSPTKLGAVSAVIACLLALRGVRERVSEDLARVILAIYEHNGSATMEELIETLDEAVPKRDIEGLLRRLEDIGAARLDNGAIRLRERVITRYTALPRVTPAT